MSQIKMCGEKPCKECPFTKSSLPGWLADYTVQDFVDFLHNEVPFPCHMTQSESLPVIVLAHKIRIGEIRLCRGYAEMMKKSCKMPRVAWLKDLLDTVTVSDEAMTIKEFSDYHSTPFTPADNGIHP
jgi:hypothetical protein